MYDLSLVDKYSKILVYGCGKTGKILLKLLSKRSVDKSNVVVWDEKFDSIIKAHGFEVRKPDFDKYTFEQNTLVIIALSTRTSDFAVFTVVEKFKDMGCANVVIADDLLYGRKTIIHQKKNTFADKAYQDLTFQNDVDFTEFKSPIKPIAFYLPQFHEIPENNEWLGEGFTEWTNTKKSKPNFKGHYQPREPHDSIGYYDLSDVEAIRKQAKLAKKHGIYGWAIYYYWFSGKKVLTKPIDLILENKEIDINFSLVWCSAKWTRAWIGDNTAILESKNLPEDPINFIDDIKLYVHDERYIRLNGKPIIMISEAASIPNLIEVITRMKERAIEIGIGEIAVISMNRPLAIKDVVDDIGKHIEGNAELCPIYYANNGVQLKDDNGVIASSRLYYYESFVKNYKQINEFLNKDTYLSLLCGFDNTPRYGSRAVIYDLGFSFKDFYELTRYIVENAIKFDKEFIFIFAWNEWAESAYLEPDKRFGFAMINTFSRALFGLSFE